MELFKSWKISPTITRIAGAGGELMYLVEGAERALLVDSGVGAGNLAAYVKTLTGKPVELVLTHGHLDHMGAAPLFETVYMNHADLPTARGYHATVEARKEFVEQQWDGGFPAADMVPQQPVDYLPLADGQSFELGGGVSVQMLALPGHTPGSMCAYFPHERSILTGDACNIFTFLFDDNTLPVEEYRAVLQRFLTEHRAKYDTVYLSHGPGDVDDAIVEGVIDVCDDILAGNTDDVPFAFMGQTHSIAKAIDPITMLRKDGGLGNIVYRRA